MTIERHVCGKEIQRLDTRILEEKDGEIINAYCSQHCRDISMEKENERTDILKYLNEVVDLMVEDKRYQSPSVKYLISHPHLQRKRWIMEFISHIEEGKEKCPICEGMKLFYIYLPETGEGWKLRPLKFEITDCPKCGRSIKKKKPMGEPLKMGDPFPKHGGTKK